MANDAENINRSPEGVTSKEQLVLSSINHVITSHNSDWHGGYWTGDPSAGTRAYIVSERKKFVNSVQNLAIISQMVLENPDHIAAIKESLKAATSELNNEKDYLAYAKKKGFTYREFKEGGPDVIDALLNINAKEYQAPFELIIRYLTETGFLNTETGMAV